jgi:hypothetical protein
MNNDSNLSTLPRIPILFMLGLSRHKITSRDNKESKIKPPQAVNSNMGLIMEAAIAKI